MKTQKILTAVSATMMAAAMASSFPAASAKDYIITDSNATTSLNANVTLKYDTSSVFILANPLTVGAFTGLDAFIGNNTVGNLDTIKNIKINNQKFTEGSGNGTYTNVDDLKTALTQVSISMGTDFGVGKLGFVGAKTITIEAEVTLKDNDNADWDDYTDNLENTVVLGNIAYGKELGSTVTTSQVLTGLKGSASYKTVGDESSVRVTDSFDKPQATSFKTSEKAEIKAAGGKGDITFYFDGKYTSKTITAVSLRLDSNKGNIKEGDKADYTAAVAKGEKSVTFKNVTIYDENYDEWYTAYAFKGEANGFENDVNITSVVLSTSGAETATTEATAAVEDTTSVDLPAASEEVPSEDLSDELGDDDLSGLSEEDTDNGLNANDNGENGSGGNTGNNVINNGGNGNPNTGVAVAVIPAAVAAAAIVISRKRK